MQAASAPLAPTSPLGRLQQRWNRWAQEKGEAAINAFGTVFIWATALHVGYLAALPRPLQLDATQRAAGRWRRLALGGVLLVGCYDAVQTSRVASQQAQEQRHYSALLKQLDADSEDP